MDEYNDRIVAGIKRTMKERQVSMKSLSDRSGIPYRSVQNYLAGTTRMPADVYVKILEVLDVDNQYIMEGNFHLKYWTLFDCLWSSLGDALLNTEYRPDTCFPDNKELHNKKQAAAANLTKRISENYNRYRMMDLKGSTKALGYPEVIQRLQGQRRGSQ